MNRSADTPQPDRRDSSDTGLDQDCFELDDNTAEFLSRLSLLEPVQCEVDVATIAFEAGRRVGLEDAFNDETKVAPAPQRAVTRWMSHPAWAVASMVLLAALVTTQALPKRSSALNQVANQQGEGEVTNIGKTIPRDQQQTAGKPADRATGVSPSIADVGSMIPQRQGDMSFWPSLVLFTIDGLTKKASMEPTSTVATTSPWRAEIYSAQKQRWLTRLVNRPQDAMTRAWDYELTALRDSSPAIATDQTTELRMRRFFNDPDGSKDLEQWLKTEGF